MTELMQNAESTHFKSLHHAVETSFSDRQDTQRIQGTATIAGAAVRYTYEQPLEEITDEVPLLIVPGYGGIKPAYRKLRTHVAQAGKPAITFRPVREHALKVALHPNYLLNPGSLPSRSAYGVLSDAQNRFDIDEFDIVGHSMGGWTTSVVAERHPTKVRSATFVASAGLEDHSTLSLLRRMPKFISRELLPQLQSLTCEDEIKFAKDSLHYALRNPYRTATEGIGVSSCDIRPSLPRLGRLGVKTAILNFKSDYLICNTTTQEEIGHLVDYCAMHEREDFGHLAPQLYPDIVAGSLVDICKQINTPADTPNTLPIPGPRKSQE